MSSIPSHPPGLLEAIREQLIRLAVRDHSLRKLVLENPRAALAAGGETADGLDASVELIALEETIHQLYLVIPPTMVELESRYRHLHDDPRYLVLRRALESAEFRYELVTCPRRVLGRHFRVSLPADIEITVLEETEKRRYVLVPDLGRSNAPFAVTAEALEGVGVAAWGSGWGGGGDPPTITMDLQSPPCQTRVSTPNLPECSGESGPRDCPLQSDTMGDMQPRKR